MPTMNLFFPRRQRVAALRILLHRLNSTVLSGGLAPRFRPLGRNFKFFFDVGRNKPRQRRFRHSVVLCRKRSRCDLIPAYFL